MADATVVAAITTNRSRVGLPRPTEPCVGTPLPQIVMAVTMADCTIANVA